MKSLLCRIALLSAFLGSLPAQQKIPPDYIVFREDTGLSNAASVVTIQQPATNPASVSFYTPAQGGSASVYCSVACVVTLERDGTAATSTSATPIPVSHGTPAAVTTAYVASNVGVGTILNRIPVAAGQTVNPDLSSLKMYAAGTGVNLTLRTNSITGDVKILMKWREN